MFNSIPFGIQIISTYLLGLYVSKLQPRYFGYLGVVVEECERHIIRAVNYVRILRNRQSSVTVDDIIQIQIIPHSFHKLADKSTWRLAIRQ